MPSHRRSSPKCPNPISIPLNTDIPHVNLSWRLSFEPIYILILSQVQKGPPIAKTLALLFPPLAPSSSKGHKPSLNPNLKASRAITYPPPKVLTTIRHCHRTKYQSQSSTPLANSDLSHTHKSPQHKRRHPKQPFPLPSLFI